MLLLTAQGSPRALQRAQGGCESFMRHLIYNLSATERFLSTLPVLTLAFRHATHAVIFRVISGSFLSPNDSRRAAAADGGAIARVIYDSDRWQGNDAPFPSRWISHLVDAELQVDTE
jgi:hypothetical protein